MKIRDVNITRDDLVRLMREHGTQEAAAKAIGLSRSTIGRLTKRFGIEWQKHYQHGNAAWQELGR